MGTIGHNHLLATARKAFAMAEPGQGSATMIEMGVRLLCMAWAEFPLNVPLAGQIVSLSGKTPLVGRLLDPQALAVVRSIAGLPSHDDPAVNSLFAQGDYEGMAARLEAAAGETGALGVAGQAVMLQSLLSNWEWLEHFVSGPVAEADKTIAELLLPDIMLAAEQGDRAIHACERGVSICGVPLGGFKLALAHAGSGNTERALGLLGRVLQEFPGHVTALSVMDSLAYPGGRDGHLPGPCVVGIYSYNKSDELARTLESVLSSDLGAGVGDVSVKVLVNGSACRSQLAAGLGPPGRSGVGRVSRR